MVPLAPQAGQTLNGPQEMNLYIYFTLKKNTFIRGSQMMNPALVSPLMKNR